MFKFVVLCALVSAAVAEPGAILSTPLAYSSAAVAQYPATYYSQPGLISSAPVVYSSPLSYPHFIKKRSAALAYSSYIAPSTYLASAPLATTYPAPLTTTYSAPILSSPYIAPAPVTYSAAHLIKKRSAALAIAAAPLATTTYTAAAPLVTSTYTAAAPLVTSTYAAAPIVSSYGYSSPLVYSGHFIKKRSAPLAVSTYLAPAAYSPSIRLAGAPLVQSYASPIAYSGAYGVTRVL